jgi:hypothetical protein
MFAIYLILPAALDPGIDTASNRNEYRSDGRLWPVDLCCAGSHTSSRA